MENYNSKTHEIPYPISVIYSKLSDPRLFKEHLDANRDRLPADALEHLEKVRFDADGIAVQSPMGELKLSVAESVEPTMVRYTAQSSPVPFALVISLTELTPDTTSAVTSLSIEIPMMLRAMVGGKLRDGAEQLGQVIARLPYDTL